VRTLRSLVLVLLASLVGAAVDRLFVVGSSPGEDSDVRFQVQNVKWNRQLDEASVTDSGTARIVGNEAASNGVYVVLYELIRSQRLNPADQPDTLWGTSITQRGSAVISGGDEARGCNGPLKMKPPECAAEFGELVANWRILGWVRLKVPTE
jgi:hypothetical protein